MFAFQPPGDSILNYVLQDFANTTEKADRSIGGSLLWVLTRLRDRDCDGMTPHRRERPRQPTGIEDVQKEVG